MAEVSIPVHACDEGWICETHPDKPWPHLSTREERCHPDHDDCPGPGMPCRFKPCEFWPEDKQRMPFMDGSPRNWVVSR